MKITRLYLSLLLLVVASSCAKSQVIPLSHSNLSKNAEGKLVLTMPKTNQEVVLSEPESKYTLAQMQGNPVGTDTSITFNFGEGFKGKMFFGLIDYEKAIHALPVFKGEVIWIKNGRASINMDRLRGKYDMIGWEQKGNGVLGYRVLDHQGNFIFDGKLYFAGTGPFKVIESIVLGPFANKITSTSAVISFKTLTPIKASVECNGKVFKLAKESLSHEFLIESLKPETNYTATVFFGKLNTQIDFETSPVIGARKPFSFAYASDSRSGAGGGERAIFGANAYTISRIMALNVQQKVKFMQFSGDLINGYLTDAQEQSLQYFNWYKAIEPYSQVPVNVSMGNHEALIFKFKTKENPYGYTIDKFPFETHSAEKLFADYVVNFENGPKSEDGSKYDPSDKSTDFPPYKETVFSYEYDNVGVIVLNSDYWYSPSLKSFTAISGGLHGYIMDNQIEWLKTELMRYENDANIDHVFVTQHTPCFPNGGHTRDDMWYKGNNDFRPFVAGKPVEKGILERRDEYLDLVVNKSSKVKAILTGDEHNYAKTEVGPNTNIYPEDYKLPKLTLSRTIYQINNGSAGAPYYAQEETPWTPFVSGFSTQNVVVFFDIEGKLLFMRVLNPITLEKVDNLNFNK